VEAVSVGDEGGQMARLDPVERRISRAEIEAATWKLIESKLDLSVVAGLRPSTPLFEGHLDSAEFIEILLFLENEYLILVRDGDITFENFGTVERIADFVERKMLEMLPS
jgi:acyl carrier protein